MSSPVDDALPARTKLLWYELDRVIGRGGFGVTYLARDTNLDQLVAIKEYFPVDSARRQGAQVQARGEEHQASYTWGLGRFILEAQTLARFRHPNIVRVLSVFEAAGTAYMVMEHEQGEDLSRKLKRGERFSEDVLRCLILSVLDGLQQVHAAGFIHRDIKPSNLLIRPAGTPVLLDFGSAREAVEGQTRTLTSMISVGFAPLEQYSKGEGKEGPWTDIYALAATLYTVVSGAPPVDAVRRAAALLMGESDPLAPAVTVARGGYSPGFLAAIDAGLQIQPGQRPRSIAQWRCWFDPLEPTVVSRREAIAEAKEEPVGKASLEPVMGAAGSWPSRGWFPSVLVVFTLTLIALLWVGGLGRRTIPATSSEAVVGSSALITRAAETSQGAVFHGVSQPVAPVTDGGVEPPFVPTEAPAVKSAPRHEVPAPAVTSTPSRVEAARLDRDRLLQVRIPEVVAGVRSAFLRADRQALIHLASISPQRQLFLEKLFAQYTSAQLEVVSQGSVGEGRALVVLRFDRLTTREGDRVSPAPAWAQITFELQAEASGRIRTYWR